MRSNKRAQREAKEMFRSSLVNGVLDEDHLRQLAHRVVAGGSRDRLGILTHLRRLVKSHLAQSMAVIESATQLPPELQADLEANLTRQYGRRLTATFSVLSELIGGVRIRVGSNVYDGSVQGTITTWLKSF